LFIYLFIYYEIVQEFILNNLEACRSLSVDDMYSSTEKADRRQLGNELTRNSEDRRKLKSVNMQSVTITLLIFVERWRNVPMGLQTTM